MNVNVLLYLIKVCVFLGGTGRPGMGAGMPIAMSLSRGATNVCARSAADSRRLPVLSGLCKTDGRDLLRAQSL